MTDTLYPITESTPERLVEALAALSRASSNVRHLKVSADYEADAAEIESILRTPALAAEDAVSLARRYAEAIIEAKYDVDEDPYAAATRAADAFVTAAAAAVQMKALSPSARGEFASCHNFGLIQAHVAAIEGLNPQSMALATKSAAALAAALAAAAAALAATLATATLATAAKIKLHGRGLAAEAIADRAQRHAEDAIRAAGDYEDPYIAATQAAEAAEAAAAASAQMRDRQD